MGIRCVIDDSGTVKIENSKVERTVSLENFLTFLQANKPFITDLLPEGTRAIGINKNLYGIMVEQPDQKRTITWKYGEGSVNLYLYFPWTYWFIGGTINPVTIHKAGIGFSEDRITGNNEIGFIALPNCSFDANLGIGIVCPGNIHIEDNQVLSNAVSQMITKIWNSKFNLDLFNIDAHIGIKAIKDILPKREEIDKEIAEYKKKDEWATFLSFVNASAFGKYMYAWHKLTANNEIDKLRKMFKLPNKTSWRSAHSFFISEMRFV